MSFHPHRKFPIPDGVKLWVSLPFVLLAILVGLALLLIAGVVYYAGAAVWEFVFAVREVGAEVLGFPGKKEHS